MVFFSFKGNPDQMPGILTAASIPKISKQLFIPGISPYFCQKICSCEQLYLVVFASFLIEFIQYTAQAGKLSQHAPFTG